MPPEVLQRAFEPFFSTKAGSRTAGLGLSTAHGVVSQAGGELTLTSELGQRHHRADPVSRGRTPRPPSAARGGPTGSRSDRRTGLGLVRPAGRPGPDRRLTILLVDDEKDLREVTARFIARAGYRVLTAGSGAEALELAERHPARSTAWSPTW